MNIGVLFENMDTADDACKALFSDNGHILEFMDISYIYSPKRPELLSPAFKWCQVLPHLTFPGDAIRFSEGADAVLIRNMDELGMAKEEGIELPLISDANLNIWNSFSLDLLDYFGISMYTAPYELTLKEIQEAKEAFSPKEIPISVVAYGHLPLMITRQCSHINSGGECTRKTKHKSMLEQNSPIHDTLLTDRKGVSFHAISYCRHCYNCIYNSVPISLISMLQKLEKAKIDEIRLCFTIEKSSDIVAYIKDFISVLKGTGLDAVPSPKEKKSDSFTYGHIKNGVE
ncbi:MAG: U32 family peptidase [Lachnospiraceae bacterium]|nr:U32 family peptidase [Lachnospiraceae bacterium]